MRPSPRRRNLYTSSPQTSLFFFFFLYNTCRRASHCLPSFKAMRLLKSIILRTLKRVSSLFSSRFVQIFNVARSNTWRQAYTSAFGGSVGNVDSHEFVDLKLKHYRLSWIFSTFHAERY